MRKLVSTVVVLAVLSCYFVLPLIAPFIILYAIAVLAWLCRKEDRVPYYVELNVAPPTP